LNELSAVAREEFHKSKLPWGRAIASAMTGTLNLVVAGSAAVGAALMNSIPILAIGGAAYVALVAWDLASPAHWKRALRSKQLAASEMPDPDTLVDATVKKHVRSLLATKRELTEVLSHNPEQVNQYVAMALGSLSELEERAARLAARAEDVSRYLAGASPEMVREEIRRLDKQVKLTSDEDARAEYQRAREAHEQKLTTLKSLADARDRLYANLSRLVATYESLPARIVHMRTLDAQAMDALSGNVNQELDRMNHEMAAFEETLKVNSAELRA